jgi:ZIP family zinc transporter
MLRSWQKEVILMRLEVGYALLMATAAGFSTWIGSIAALFMYRPKAWVMSLMLGFSAGVMIYVSFAELLKAAVIDLGQTTANIAFFGGIVFIAVIDVFIPHEYKEEHVTDSPLVDRKDIPAVKGTSTFKSTVASPALLRMGLLTAVGIGIHNFPEGLVVFSSAVTGNVAHGFVVALAVGLHNIPEGISVSLPILAATGSRKKAFFYSFISGLAEPVGALIGYLILLPFLSPGLVSGLLAFAAGIMVYISLDELLPAAHSFGKAHVAIIGIGTGMVVMAVSLILLNG